jgi:hypothetical protein
MAGNLAILLEFAIDFNDLSRQYIWLFEEAAQKILKRNVNASNE